MPKIYVASLSDYNAGRLHEVWIDCSMGEDHIQEEVNKMLASSPESRICQWCGKNWGAEHENHIFLPGNAEEWAIHDYEEFGGLALGEYESFEFVAELAELIEKYDGAFVAWCGTSDRDQWTESDFEDAYSGHFESQKDFAMDFADQVGTFGEVPDHLQNYIDWDSYAEDFTHNYSFESAPNGGVYVFNQNY